MNSKGPKTEMASLCVMKFGGTSVGDASCIARAAAIVKSAASEGSVVVVVSAMSGVTNRLIDAAHRAEAGDAEYATKVVAELRNHHKKALEALVRDAHRLAEVDQSLGTVLAELERLLQGTALLRELTPRALDTISGMGERLSTPLLAAALNELGVSSVPVSATEVIVTDPHHGRAEPLMDHTRERAEKRLRPLLKKGVVPVVTGFIGATIDGVPTTLGRGGSDYSATILGAALGAQETIIWTDVDGVKTADPKLVPEARTIDEISYNEAAELAYFGAKVLHPNTLRPVTAAGVPVWIRNSFAPEKAGTKITARGNLQWRRREGADRYSRRHNDHRRRPGHRGTDGCAGKVICGHGRAPSECAFRLAVIFAKRYLLRDLLRGRERHRRGAASSLCSRNCRANRGARLIQFRDRRRCRSWRKYARHTGGCRAYVFGVGARRDQHHRHRAGLLRVQHIAGGRS